MLPSGLFAIVVTLLRPLTWSARLPGLALAMAMLATHAVAAPDPFSREFYSKYPAPSEIIKREPGKCEPPTRAELANLDAFLDRMRRARDRLQNQCIGGSKSSLMVRKFGGQTILVMPDLFAECEDDAKMLQLGGSVHDQTVIPNLMRSFNAYWNAQYSPPKPDPADLKAWRDKARSMTRFDDHPSCNGMAGMLIDTLEGRSSTKKPREIFDQYSPTCGSAWKKMFESSLPKPSPVAQPTDRLSREFYPLYPKTTGEWAAVPGKGAPPPKSGIKAFEDHLANMQVIRERFRLDCIGSNSGQMVHKQRGENVLAWPDQFKNCESDAKKLFERGSFDNIMATDWNPYWGANYAPPRGDSADEESWKRWKGRLVRFNEECEDASWRIIQSGKPGFPGSPEQVFKRMEKRCPPSWVALFEPEDATKKKELEAKKRCKPGTSYAVVDEKSGNGSREECDESDKFIPPDSAKDGRSQKKDPLADELAAIQRGEFERPAGTGESVSSTQAMLNARRQAGAGLTAAMENGVRQQPKAGSIGGMQIFGGENGQLLEMALNSQALGNLDAAGNPGAAPPSSKECDMGAEEAYFAQQIKALEGRISSMSIEQQQCAAARTYAQGLRRLVAAQQRCGQSNNAAQNQAALNNVQSQEQTLCNGKAQGGAPTRPAQTAAPYQAPRSAPPPSKSPTTPARPSGGTSCDRCLPDR